MKDAHVTHERVGGRELRIATWRLDKAYEHPPVLFFNGIGANIEAVAPMMDAMPERAFIIFDMPGTGGSPDPLVPYNPFTMSWTAHRLLRRLKVDLVDVMGVSWGGALAQHFALQHPGSTRRVVLAATNAGLAMVPGDPGAFGLMANPLGYSDTAFMNELFASLYGQTMDPKSRAEKEAHIGRLRPPSPIGYTYQLMSMMGWTSLPALPFMDKPTLILMGEDDRVVPVANGHILHHAIPGSRLVTFKGAGHLFLMTHARESLPEIRAFLGDENEQAPERLDAETTA